MLTGWVSEQISLICNNSLKLKPERTQLEHWWGEGDRSCLPVTASETVPLSLPFLKLSLHSTAASAYCLGLQHGDLGTWPGDSPVPPYSLHSVLDQLDQCVWAPVALLLASMEGACTSDHISSKCYITLLLRGKHVLISSHILGPISWHCFSPEAVPATYISS